MSLYVQKNSAIWILILLLFPVINLFGSGVFDYYDEIVGLVASMIVLYWYLQHSLDRTDRCIVTLTLIITAIGLISNIVTGSVTNIFAILVDVLWLWKTFFCFILFKNIARTADRRQGILDFLTPVAKATVIFIVLCAIVSIFADIGASGSTVVGSFRQYTFFWGNTIQTGWLLFSCLCILAANSERSNYLKYLLISAIPVFLTFSSLVYCWYFVTIAMTIFLREESKVKVWHIIALAVGVIAFIFADVREYFLSESIRSTFWRAAFQLANSYFPLGTGFASFGSEMASRYYSSVYVQLGWKGTWGLGEGSSYLNDTFFASILGQFGWIGIILYLAILALLFIYVNNHSHTKEERICCMASVLTIAASMIGSSTAKSMMGCCMFAVLGVIMGHSLSEEDSVIYYEK